jgi:Na+-driven multidrug efflux pump
MGLCADHNPDGTFDDAVAGFNAAIRIYALAEGVRYAVSMGLLPAISYAYTSHQVDRIFWLILHASWINAAWGAATCLATAFGSRYLAMLISKSEEYLMWATPMMRASNWEAAFAWFRNEVQTILQALQYGVTATVYSFCTTFFASIGATYLLYYTNDADCVRLMYAYPMGSGFSVVVGVRLIFFPLRKLWRSKVKVEEEGAIQLQDIGFGSGSIEEGLLANDPAANEH